MTATRSANRAVRELPVPRGGLPVGRSLRRSHEGALGLLLALPAIVLLGLFMLWPVLTAVQYSFTTSSGFGDREPAGWDNYHQALTEQDFWGAILRNCMFAGVVTVASIVLGFVLAYLLFLRVRAWRTLQFLLMLPYILPVVVTGLLWKYLMQPQTGLFNSVLRDVGLGSLANPWLSGQDTALPSVSLVQVWLLVPLATLFLYGAMLSIPTEVLEAAQMDGAGHTSRMIYVVLPMVRPTVVLTAVILAIGLFRSFDLIWILTQGGPIHSTTIATLYVFVQGFVNNNYGYANATGIIVGLLLAGVTVTVRVVQARATRAREEA